MYLKSKAYIHMNRYITNLSGRVSTSSVTEPVLTQRIHSKTKKTEQKTKETPTDFDNSLCVCPEVKVTKDKEWSCSIVIIMKPETRKFTH
jgi:hypothetical protein